MGERVEKFLGSKNESARRSYRRGFQLFRQYARKKLGEDVSGEKLIRMVAEERRKNIEERGRPEIEILKGFFKWLDGDAPRQRGEGRGYSRKTCHSYLSGITEFLNYHDLPVNRKKLNLPKPTRKKNNRKLNIRRDQVKRLAAHAKLNRDKAVILCLWQSGMSLGDLLDLNVGDVKVEDPIRGSLDDPPLLIKLTRKKAGVEYRTLFGHDACKALRRYLDERERTLREPERGDPLFTQQRKRGGEKYKRLTRGAVEMMFRRLALRAGLVTEERMEEADFNPLRPHALRAGFSSVLKEEGVNQSIIDGLTGHSVGYDSAYHNFTDKQLRELYKEHEDILSIEQVSIPRESEIEEVVKKHFGELGVERVMPDLERTVEEMDSRLSRVENEVRKRENLLKILTDGIEDLDETGSLDEIVDGLVEEKLGEKLGGGVGRGTG